MHNFKRDILHILQIFCVLFLPSFLLSHAKKPSAAGTKKEKVQRLLLRNRWTSWSSRAGQIRTCRGTAPPSCLLALRTIKLPFQSSRVIFLGRSPAEEHLPGIIQAKECMKKKKHISEEQHYLCEIGLEKMPYGLLYQSYTEESLTHITITAAPCKVPALP